MEDCDRFWYMLESSLRWADFHGSWCIVVDCDRSNGSFCPKCDLIPCGSHICLVIESCLPAPTSSSSLNILSYHLGMNISWVAESGLADNIYRMVKEYKQTRNLLPLRVFLTGPPAAGKTTVVKQLCEHYKVNFVLVEIFYLIGIKFREDKFSRISRLCQFVIFAGI